MAKLDRVADLLLFGQLGKETVQPLKVSVQ
jgi:hypothetical protein